MKDKVVFLGVRGSVPVSGEQYVRYGGNTTCIAVTLSDELIILDAGTGLCGVLQDGVIPQDVKNLPILLTHTHIDHIMGFVSCPKLYSGEFSVKVYGKEREGLSVKEQIGRLVSPPLWPVGLDIIAPKLSFAKTENTFSIGKVTVKTFEGCHPGGVTVYKLCGEKNVVFMTDCTVTDANREELREFCGMCDLLIIDGQYTNEEWRGREHFGHNTYASAVGFAEMCGAKQTRITHHAPNRTDFELDGTVLNGKIRFAHEKEVIEL